MRVSEFTNIDNTFNEAMFLTKVNNIFIKFFTSIMTDKLAAVDHFISDDVYNYGENILNKVRSKNYRQMYDELNVKNSRISNIEVTDKGIKVVLESTIIEKDSLFYHNFVGRLVNFKYNIIEIN